MAHKPRDILKHVKQAHRPIFSHASTSSTEFKTVPTNQTPLVVGTSPGSNSGTPLPGGTTPTDIDLATVDFSDDNTSGLGYFLM